ncbi:glycosyltransferase family 2 protein [Candidatus Methylospira mobilis]|uniref:Glycosyltransferase family 2 protein n=1 Tax=Candidatus Methylospira mobilis TaxID=1808979 RepID=A0A5Q0BHS6_9GAMM|nr:glycosyltransferase family 2 protein [Candidatus Methylospira mobilis]QFY41376.1 glycosyltransferase family 2 protein [Candidatus Methylospira mobilis]
MRENRTLLSIVTPCYNEQDNVDELYKRIKAAVAGLTKYNFELIFIDNHSEDDTVSSLKALAAADPMVKIIVNTRNFGHIRSPYYGILQSSGAATIYLASDLQDPPELIPEFIEHWEAGYKLVMATKPVSKGTAWVHALRKAYYRFLDDISDISLVADSTGFGLYDREVLDNIRKVDDPYPFLRGLICELGYEIKTIQFTQPRRLRGISKNNFYTLYDIAMLGIVSHSKMPIRIAAFMGFALGAMSVIVAMVFLFLKLMFWDMFSVGMAPLVIGLFFLFGIQLLFIGILGEYIGSIHTYLQRRPVVVEKERINFD